MTDDLALDRLATLRGSAQSLVDLVTLSAADYHDTLYLQVDGDNDVVHVITQTNGQQVMSYCSFTGLQAVEGRAEAILPTGLDNDTKGALDYLDIAAGDGTVELRLLGESGDPQEDAHPWLASYWQADGALQATVRLDTAEDSLNRVPWLLPDRWTADDQYLSRSALDDDGNIAVDDDELSEYTPPTRIQTDADAVSRELVDAADFLSADSDADTYPLVTDDGELVLDLESASADDSLIGDLTAENVTGPDISREFDEGFAEVIDTLPGPITLSTAPYSGGADAAVPPLVVTQTGVSGRTLRHVLGGVRED